MANHHLLNNVDHHDLRIDTTNAAEFGDNQSIVQTFSSEFVQIQKDYPIFFQHNPQTQQIQAVALLGLQEGENLFLSETDGWQAKYIPAVMTKGPFLIGFQNQTSSGGQEHAPVVHIDLDNPRVNKEKGEAVFLEHGGNSPYLNHVSKVLMSIMDGMPATEAMIKAFTELNLLSDVNIEFTLANNEKHTLSGLQTIDEDKLNQLDAETIKALQQSGILYGAYLVISSFSNLQNLVNLKNAKAQAGV
jgi:hypothetical protein